MRTTRLRGARTHNLRSIDLDLEPGTLVAICGPSGAGKSSLAFGTLYAEGQRRYVESFSAYARQFLERLARPPLDRLDPVPAAIAVDRQAPVKTSRSTVGTMTELTDYTKALWARASSLECPTCGRPVKPDAPTDAATTVLTQARGERLTVSYPVQISDPEQFLGVRQQLLADGYRRVLIDGALRDLDEVRPSDILGEATPIAKKKATPKKPAKASKSRKKEVPVVRANKTLTVVADRTVAREEDRARLVEALEQAMSRGDGRADVRPEHGEPLRFSKGLHCAHCDRAFRPATAGTFSFNSPVGACKACKGFGRVITVDWDRVLPNRALTLGGGAIKPWGGASTQWERNELKKHAPKAGVPLDVSISKLTPEQYRWLIEGDAVGWPNGWGGLRGWFQWLESRAYKMHVRVFLSRYRKYAQCEACGGSRLEPEAQWWRIGGKSISEIWSATVADALAFFEAQTPLVEHDPATSLVLRECVARARTLVDVGLEYLSLDRPSRTLSGGEAQRVALTSALGASLTGAMFVLDEPTVGLHPADVGKLFDVVRRLTDGNNIAIVVEHDLGVIEGADRVVELGPRAGEHGGRIVFDGPPGALAQQDSATGRALSAPSMVHKERRAPKSWLHLRGAVGHNLQTVDLALPLGVITCVTGPSGSGKSSLVLETLVPAVAQQLAAKGMSTGNLELKPLVFGALSGHEALRGVVHVDQSPLGRTSRGNPATYLAAWDVIRAAFAKQPLAKERGYGPGFFSFNVAGGRCEACRGEGAETVEMQFLADVTFSCPECGGRRFTGPVLDVKLGELDCADVLELTADEALARLPQLKELRLRLEPLIDVGLGYLRLGQPLSTLSGGEAQRLKLAEALAGSRAASLVVLDEPTAGLHPEDVSPLLAVLDRLVARGDTVVVVEHDMRVAAHADHVIDLGPGAGALGGRIVAAGTPEEVARAEGSRTSPYLGKVLGMAAPKSRRKTTSSGALRAPRVTREEDHDTIVVTHAREHNLKNVSLEIPREKLVVVTGPSGSGKSTLAFDVIHAEAQRRYLETLSPFARQYLPQLPRPNVDRVTGLPPSVSLEQRVTRSGANSTVATLTEVAHHLRLVWARAGLLHCPDCGVPIAPRQASALAADVRRRHGAKADVTLLAPVVRARKGHHGPVFARAAKDGFTEARIDGKLLAFDRNTKVDRFKEHDIDLVTARTKPGAADFEELVRRTLVRGDGAMRVLTPSGEELLSSKRACPSCGRGFPELDPRFFSFNTKQGQCETCEGHGYTVRTVGKGPNAKELHDACTACSGTRLSKLARAVTLDGKPITDVLSCSVTRARQVVSSIQLEGREAEVAKVPIQELLARLQFLQDVGLGYLGLDRAADTLSGGETQRVRLAAQLGSGLTGLLYVLDEPTIGLHPRDTDLLLVALRALVDKGCSVMVVEHDSETIRAADHLIDVGPGGGVRGGNIVCAGPAKQVLADPRSITGSALARVPKLPKRRSVSDAKWIELTGAREHNLRDVTLRIPTGRLVAITGVSGSGKSTLVRDVLLRAVRKELDLVTDAPPGGFASIRGVQHVKRAIEVDQSPIGRTPRSVPATYVGVWDELRRLLAATPEARARGFSPSRFSFNVAEGRCPACEGQGATSVEMSFLPEVLVPCETCGGARFTDETRLVKLNGLDASQLLELDVEEGARLLSAFSKVAAPLQLLSELGLGYLKLGQPSNTLSGGEAQRMKLVAELGTTNAGPTLYVLDEPTTGLHRDDVARLVVLFEKLVARGDTVVVIEHHTDVMCAADWLIDLGPEGGEGGGTIVAQGTPEDVAKVKASHTGRVIAKELRAR